MEGSGEAERLARVFEAAGYRLLSRAEGWLAERALDRRAIIYTTALRAPTDFESAFPASAIHRTILYPEDPGAVAREIAADRGMEVLSPATLGAALGELLLLPPSASPSLSSELPLETPAAAVPEGARTVRARMRRDEAIAAAGGIGLRCTLRLIPYYVAPYRVRTPSPHGAPGVVTEHLAAVNALQQTVEFWLPGEHELADRTPEPHQRLEAALAPTEAPAIALEAIRRHHTVSVEHTEQHGGTLVIETRRVPPPPDHVRLGAFALVHVPFWYLESSKGRVVLDAVTGARPKPALEAAPIDRQSASAVK